MPITRSKIIKRVAAANGLSDRAAATAFAAVIDAIAARLKDAERVEVRGFGAFTPRNLPARTTRNPRTGECFLIGSKKVVKFKAGKALSALLNGDPDECYRHRVKRDRQCRLRDERGGQLTLF